MRASLNTHTSVGSAFHFSNSGLSGCAMTNPDENDMWKHIRISPGEHSEFGPEMNVLECVAFVAKVEHSSYPLCACPVASFLVLDMAESATPAQRQQLAQFILPLSSSAANLGVVFERLVFSADYTIRTLAPRLLTRFGLPDEAACLEALPPLINARRARQASDVLRKLFLATLLSPERSSSSLALLQLQQCAEIAALVHQQDAGWLSVLKAVCSVNACCRKRADVETGAALFEMNFAMVEALLNIGPVKLEDGEMQYRKQRLARLASFMAQNSTPSGLPN